MNKIKCYLRLITLAVTMLTPFVPAQAGVIIGRIIDAESNEPLENVEIKMENAMRRKGMVYAVISFTQMSDSIGHFCLDIPFGSITYIYQKIPASRVSVTFSFIGYRTLKRSFLFGDSNDTLRVGDIKMKVSDVLLKYAEVKGHAKRFYMRGDTVVFNPKAFRLAEGARVEELIKKLDGVSTKDGKLTWMGKPLRILVDGEELFGDNNLLISRLPAEAVDRIKTYNKASEGSFRTGRDDGKRDQVLDIKIKPGWLDRWYADTEAGVQTKARYTATLDAFRLSKSDPMMFFAKANNVNDKVFRKVFNSSAMSKIGNYGKEQFGSVGYKHLWKPKQHVSYENNNVFFNFEGGHDDALRNSHSNNETFLPGKTHTYMLNGSDSRACLVNPQFNFGLFLNLDSLTTFNFKANLKYTKTKTNGTNRLATFSQSPYELDSDPLNNAFNAQSSILHSQLINSRDEHSLDDTEGGGGNIDAVVTHYFKNKSSMTLAERFNYYNSRALNFLHRDLRYTDNILQNSFSNIYSHSKQSSLSNTVELAYEHWIAKNVQLRGSYAFDYTHDYSRSSYYHLDRLVGYDAATAAVLGNRPTEADSLTKAFDAANSPVLRTDVYRQNVQLASTINFKRLTLIPSLDWRFSHECLDYQRGRIDTSAVRNTVALSPAILATLKTGKYARLEANYSHNTYFPELLSTVGYRDDTDPLNVVEGNPGLHAYYEYRAGLSYTLNLTKAEQSITASSDYHKQISTPGYVMYYNPATGAYRSHQENMHGGDWWHFAAGYERTLIAGLHVRNDFDYVHGKNYGTLATTIEGLRPKPNLQRTNNIDDELEFSYGIGDFDVSMPLSIKYRRVRNSQGSTTNVNLYDYNAGINGRYTWRNFSFSTSFNIQKRSGYLTAGMNRTLPLWNAQVDWRVLKNKGRLSLSCVDILNKDISYNASQTLTSRNEYWQESLHNYIRLTFTYHFDAKVKE